MNQKELRVLLPSHQSEVIRLRENMRLTTLAKYLLKRYERYQPCIFHLRPYFYEPYLGELGTLLGEIRVEKVG